MSHREKRTLSRMALREREATGTSYLELVTTLLQRMRLAHRTTGLWEAGDFQWWWRQPRASDSMGQLFWLDDASVPVAAVVFTDWRGDWACDLLIVPDEAETLFPVVWARALERIDSLPISTVEVAARDDDALQLASLEQAGFTSTGEEYVETWMPSDDRPEVAPLPDGFRLLDRAGAADRPHHMIPRSGEHVAERLFQTSLYRPELDLFVEAPDGDAAAYGLFWCDPVTGVGLVEPMRAEEDYQRRGLARHVLATGLDRLASLGCTRLKVSYEPGNIAARNLYLNAGFQPESTSRLYTRRRV